VILPRVPEWISDAVAQRHLKSLASCHEFLAGQYALMDQHVSNEYRGEAFLYCFVGHRPRVQQQAAYDAGRSNAQWGESWHNMTPALAMDVVPVWRDNPHSIEWGSARTRELLHAVAGELPLTWGGNFSSLDDPYHFQMFPQSKPPQWAIDGFLFDLRRLSE
jgi:hypothetical protein